MATFEKLRLSLIREEPGELLRQAAHEEIVRPRSEFIRAAFAQERPFLSKGNRVLFTPLRMPEGYAGGFFTRERPVSLKHGDLSPYDAENFEGLLVIVSLDSNQHVWAEINRKVAAAKPLLESFFGYLLTNTEINDYQAVLRYVDAAQEYWRVIREHRHEIRSISFTFIPPNPLDLGADDEIYSLINAVQDELNPDTQNHTYKTKTPGKMNPETPHIEASARIAMKGGGQATVRGEKGLLYSSESQKARTTEVVEDDDMPTPEHPSFVQRVIARLFAS